MVPDVSTGSNTRGLLAYLYGPGRRDEHTDPHIVAAWDIAGAPDPGRDPEATLSQLARRLDAHILLRARELGGAKPPKHVWHCPVRTAPGDRYLTDAEWAQVAHRIVAATGIAPDGDDQACRWIAVRHADDHIHILATTVRTDGRRPRTHRDGQRAQRECRAIEEEFGLRRLKPGDLTAPKTPTSAEQAKAARQGKTVTSRAWLRDQAYAVLATASNEQQFFATLAALGIQTKTRLGPHSGEVIGYSLTAPGDLNAHGQPVWYGGSKLAPDLSIHRIRERLTAQDPTDHRSAATRPSNPWHRADTALRQAAGVLQGDDDTAAQAQLAALGELLHTTALASPAAAWAPLRAAATAFNRATRSTLRANHRQAAALRSAAKELSTVLGSDQDGEAAVALLCTALLLIIAAERWYEARGHAQQAAAARQAAEHLHTGYHQAAQPLLADLARRAPGPQAARRFEADLRQALPEHAERILADPAWPALTTTLAKAESRGRQPRDVLREAAEQRELDTAHSPAEVLHWRITTLPDKRATAAAAHGRYTSSPTTPSTPPIRTVGPVPPVEAADHRRRSR